ncbi:hypothetical protein [Streptomyces sp. NPDC093991]|uniref:hypothetical protein n=1 Tax=unclassified Streptomyces TaxID=2593676 RepID=UPI00342CD060
MARESTGQSVDDSYEPWRDLTTGIRALRLPVYDITDRLRSVVARRPSWPRGAGSTQVRRCSPRR